MCWDWKTFWIKEWMDYWNRYAKRENWIRIETDKLERWLIKKKFGT